MSLGFLDRVLAKMKNAGGQYRVSLAFDNTVGQVIKIAYTSRRNHRHLDSFADSTGKLQVKTDFGAVTIHACQQNLAGSIVDHFLSPANNLDSCRLASAMGEDFPARLFTFAADPLGVYRYDDAL